MWAYAMLIFLSLPCHPATPTCPPESLSAAAGAFFISAGHIGTSAGIARSLRCSPCARYWRVQQWRRSIEPTVANCFWEITDFGGALPRASLLKLMSPRCERWQWYHSSADWAHPYQSAEGVSFFFSFSGAPFLGVETLKSLFVVAASHLMVCCVRESVANEINVWDIGWRWTWWIREQNWVIIWWQIKMI